MTKCKEDTRCKTEVGVDVKLEPNIRTKEVYRRGGKIDFYLEVEPRPKCKIVQKPCSKYGRCEFEVIVDFEPEVHLEHKPCENAHLRYELGVDIDHRTSCTPINIRYDGKKLSNECQSPQKQCNLRESYQSTSSSSSMSEQSIPQVFCKRNRN